MIAKRGSCWIFRTYSYSYVCTNMQWVSPNNHIHIARRLTLEITEMSLNVSPFALSALDDVSTVLGQAHVEGPNTKDLLRVQGEGHPLLCYAQVNISRHRA